MNIKQEFRLYEIIFKINSLKIELYKYIQNKMPYIDYDNSDFDIKNDNTKLIPSDKYFYKIKRTILDETKTLRKNDGRKYLKNVTIGIFGSGQVGSRIRNAITGHKYNFLVGSKDQKKLYSVALCTGENGIKCPVFMFYDSPEQYENHLLTKLPIEAKSEWYMKKTA